MIDFELDIPATAEEPEIAYKVNRELNMAWEIVEETGANLFLTGRAGTGKTTFLKKLREATGKRMIVLAPTGVAAINASGNTMHSFFQLPFSVFVPGKGFLTNDRKYLNMSRQKKRLISSLSLLVIDEISMVRPDVLDAVDSMLRRLRNSTRPFGGVQLLMIGDIRQLPPVVNSSEWEILKEHYETPYFFESHALKKAGFETVELSVVYRQSDSAFIDILNNIRDGEATGETLELLNRRALPGFKPADNEGYIRLTTHNYRAAQINEARLAALPFPEFCFEAEIKGEFPESAFPAERNLRLKEGAQVMFIKNDTGGSVRRYYNGMIGTVTSISDEKIKVRPQNEEAEIDVEKTEWENTRYAIDPSTREIRQESVGAFRQYPLQLAWAITIHKSQGLTFDRAIIDAAYSFAPGQTYVALSRCRSLEGLVLDAPIPPSAVITDSGVNRFVGEYENNMPDASKVQNLKHEYLYTLLAELFDFEPLRRAFNDFSRYVTEYIVPMHPEIETGLRDIGRQISSDLCEVGRKFISSYNAATVAQELAKPDRALAKRIKKGSMYFLEIISGITSFIKNLPKDIDNQAYAERLNNAYFSLSYLLKMKSMLLEDMGAKDFSIKSFLDAKARASLESEKPESASSKKKQDAKIIRHPDSGEKKPRKPKGYSTFETLRMYKEGLGVREIAARRELKENTVGSHLLELVRLGKLTTEDVVGEPAIEMVRNLMGPQPGGYMEYLEKAGKKGHEEVLPSYAYNICKEHIINRRNEKNNSPRHDKLIK